MNRLLALTAAMTILIGCDEIPDPSLPNEPPVANDDAFSILQNEVTILGVLDNDFDIDGDPLEIVITQEPVNGTLQTENGILIYSPELYFVGADEFAYQITDLVGNTSSATATIDILKKEVRAIFSTVNEGRLSVYELDSRNPTVLTDVSEAVPVGENILAWEVSEQLQQAIFLTDADRVLTVSLDDPETLAAEFDIDTTSGAIDGGLALSNSGEVAAVTLDHRFLVALGLNDGQTIEFDTGFSNGSTMSPQFFSSTDNLVILSGTLGTGAEERSAIYALLLTGTGVRQVLDDADSLDDPVTRLIPGLNGMAWLTADPASDVPPAAYSCTAPPPQVFSDASFSALGIPDAGVNLNEASGLLADPSTTLSYNNGNFSSSLFITACPPATELFQIIQVPYLDPSAARVVATATDASDGLWNLDVSSNGSRLVYAVEGETGLRVITLDLSDTDPASTDLTASVPGYATFTSGMETRVPPSVISGDQLRWVFLKPVDDALTELNWLQFDGGEMFDAELPFVATNLLSDGLFALVQGPTGSDSPAPIALIELDDPVVVPVEVPGILEETTADPFNQIESAIRLIRAP